MSSNDTAKPHLIEIVEDSATNWWAFTDPDTKQVYDSRFELRIVPKSVERELRKKHTKFEFTRQGRQENFAAGPFADDVIDFAVVNWEGVRRQGQELPCTREWKTRLPEVVRGEIIRLCLGRELGMVLVGTEPGSDEELEGEQRADPPLRAVARMARTEQTD